MDGALSGYRVLDLTDEKGMLCARLLGDMGAEVIRVESPQGTADRDSPAFFYLNAGKRSISLNLAEKAGQELFKRLVRTADVVVESGPPGYLEGLGAGYPELSEVNPRLIMASITGFGQDGPYRDYRVSDIVASALGGQMYVCGEAGAPPLKPSGDQSYNTACLFTAIGVLLALWQRHATGRGQHVDVSAMESVAATLDHVLVRYFHEGVVARRQGSLHWNGAFRVFPCRDGHILLSLFQQWPTLVEWLEAEGMAGDLGDERWRDRDERLRHLDHIVEILERWTISHTVDELVEKGQLMRFPWAKVTTMPELVNGPQLAERGFFVEAEDLSSGRKYKHPGAPCKLSRSPWRAGGRVAMMAEDNLDIYHRGLGLPRQEIEALAKDGVI